MFIPDSRVVNLRSLFEWKLEMTLSFKYRCLVWQYNYDVALKLQLIEKPIHFEDFVEKYVYLDNIHPIEHLILFLW